MKMRRAEESLLKDTDVHLHIGFRKFLGKAPVRFSNILLTIKRLMQVELRQVLFDAQYFVLLQGFSKDIRMQKSSYIGYIKDYEGATLMHVSTS